MSQEGRLHFPVCLLCRSCFCTGWMGHSWRTGAGAARGPGKAPGHQDRLAELNELHSTQATRPLGVRVGLSFFMDNTGMTDTSPPVRTTWDEQIKHLAQGLPCCTSSKVLAFCTRAHTQTRPLLGPLSFLCDSILHTHTCTHACTHAHAHIHTHMHAHTRPLLGPLSFLCDSILHTYIHVHTHAHACTHMCTCTHTHTHTHACTYPAPPWSPELPL